MTWVRRWIPAALALLAGVAWPAAFAPLGWSPVALVSLAVLFGLWRCSTPAAAFRRGYVFGLGVFGVGVSWVYISMYWYGGMGAAMSVAITALLAATMALFPALAGLVGAVLSRGRGGGASAAILAGIWTLSEWARGWFLTGFTWLQIGYSQIDTALAGYAPALGVYGTSLAAALIAGLALGAAGRKVLPGRRAGMLIGAALVWLGGALLLRIDWTEEAGPPLRVALVQGNIAQDLKWLPEMRETSVAHYWRLSEPHWATTDLVVWPETAMPMTLAEARPWLEALTEAAGEATLLTGLIFVDPRTGRYYNTMVDAARPDAMYHKRHLVPFTEYLPLRGLLGGLVDALDIPMSDFAAGADRQPLMDVSGQPIGMSICFEDAFGEELVRDLPEASLLVNVSNDAWFQDSAAPAQHLQIARMRALEAGRWLARGTNTGMTAFVDQRGRLVAEAPPFESTVLTARVPPRRGATPYARLGNAGVVVLALLLVMAGRQAGRRGEGAG